MAKKRITLSTSTRDLFKAALPTATPGNFVELDEKGNVCKACLVGRVALMAGVKPETLRMGFAALFRDRHALEESQYQLTPDTVGELTDYTSREYPTVRDFREAVVEYYADDALVPANRLGRY